MGFSAKQVKALQRGPDHRHIPHREANGRERPTSKVGMRSQRPIGSSALTAWSRETIESKCVLAREKGGTFLAVYISPGAPHRAGARNEHDCAKAMAPGEGREHRPARCTTLPLKAAGDRCHQEGTGYLWQTLWS